jgi:hypothetical protein
LIAIPWNAIVIFALPSHSHRISHRIYATGMLEDDLTFGKLFEALKVEYEYPSEEKSFSGEYNL